MPLHPGIAVSYVEGVTGIEEDRTIRRLNLSASSSTPGPIVYSIERTVKEAPKTYADIIKASTTNTKEKAIAEMRARQRQQRDALRRERAKYEVTLTMKETNDEVKELNDVNRLSRKPPSLASNYKELTNSPIVFVSDAQQKSRRDNFVLLTGVKP